MAHPEPDDPFEQLRRAREAYEQLDDGADTEAWLRDHEPLRGLLEPMVEADAELPSRERERILGNGDFRIVGEIGRGGMGIVYEARQLSLGRKVALKQLAHELSRHPTAVARFRREATLAAGLRHPAIAQVHGFLADPEGLFLVMELVDGAALDAVLRQRATTIDRRGRVRIAMQIAEALAHAHHRGVIHRDVKPSNILVRDDGSAVLTDFGLARETGLIGVTRTGEAAGTPAYQSPEQIQGRAEDLGPTTDVFSLGATLYELVTDQRAFEGETALQVQQNVLRVDPKDPRRIDDTIDRDLAAIIMRSVEKSPAERYPTADAFAADLHAWLDGGSVTARPIGRTTRVTRWCHRNPLAASFVGLLLVAVLVTTLLMRDARRSLRLFEWLAVGVRVEAALKAYRDAPPAWPENVSAFDRLLSQAHELTAELPTVEANVETARALGAPGATGELVFSRVEDQFLYVGTQEALGRLEHLRDHVVAALEERRAWAQRVEAESIDAYRSEWTAASRVAAERFGIALPAQIGLAPLGVDAHSGLLEFWQIRSGTQPSRVDGRVRIEADTALVFVLVPQGEFVMGCQNSDPAAPNYDPDARTREQPLHPVTIDEPFFLSKFELSRGQWRRLLHDDEEYAKPDAHSAVSLPGDLDTYPIEHESCDRARHVLGRYGLTLPTEAQWEYACRAGTTTRWATGATIESLSGHANVRDQCLMAMRDRIMLKKWDPFAPFDDGFPRQAPVDAFSPNTFGFHQMHGNLREFCGDTFCPDYASVTHDASDGAAHGPTAVLGLVPVRGGYYASELLKTASGIRNAGPARDRRFGIGIRPARRLRRDR